MDLLPSLLDKLRNPDPNIALRNIQLMKVSSKLEALNDHEFVATLDCTDFMKYSTTNHKWTRLQRLADRANVLLMIMDKEENRLFILTGNLDSDNRRWLKVVDVLTGSVMHRHELQDKRCLINDIGLVNAKGTIHLIGGYQYHHATWNIADGVWNVNRECPWKQHDRLVPGPLVYVESKNCILMIGGNLVLREGGEQMDMGVWRIQVATSKWEQIEVDGEFRGHQAVLSSDQQSVIIVGMLKMYILDIQNEDKYTVIQSIGLPRPSGYLYPVVVKNQETNVVLLTSAWFRKSFSSTQHEQVVCPLDILKLIDQFVCQEWLHLISEYVRDGTIKHFAVPLAEILSLDSIHQNTWFRERPGMDPANYSSVMQRTETWLIPLNGFTRTQITLCLSFLLVAYLYIIYVDWSS